MNTENNTQDRQALPYDLKDDLGVIISSEWQCPGVWYAASEGDGLGGGELYIVQRDTASISDAAKRCGVVAAHHPELLLYDLDEPQKGRGIVAYEIDRYRQRNGLPLPEGESLLTAAVYGMETNPEYFGSFPAPTQTPRGTMTRYQAIVNGIFLLETHACERMVAVSYPLWKDSLTDYTKSFAEQTDYDQRHGIDTTLGCLFFPEEHGCLALFELTREFPEILTGGLVHAPSLYNAIWERHPDYAALFNRMEQRGLNDALGLLLRSIFGEEVELSGSLERMISYHLDAGVDYLRL